MQLLNQYAKVFSSSLAAFLMIGLLVSVRYPDAPVSPRGMAQGLEYMGEVMLANATDSLTVGLDHTVGSYTNIGHGFAYVGESFSDYAASTTAAIADTFTSFISQQYPLSF